ncbi:AGC/RSK protein kinase [Polytolypa hystricis UAMH7299]|uniref:AGC/RSK protein kinase n=1 Tax=Polytolypa hystricis (strain UAMH7299) TaxID=1447883 RepID=A0A2B7YPW1_POLH7|nr:AGC/RSK protein kinase [Polytolypa hystricis UAMH7299]
MYTSSSQHRTVEHDIIPLTHSVVNKAKSAAWLAQEEFTVSDVFAPQGTEFDEGSAMEGVHYAGNRASASEKPAAGIRHGHPQVSPTRKDRVSPNGVKNGIVEPGNTTKEDATIGESGAQHKYKNGADENNRPGIMTVRGFNPVSPGQDEFERPNPGSGSRTPWLQPLGDGGSPSLRPSSSHSGVGALKCQLDALNISGGRSTRASKLGFESPSCTSGASDTDDTELTTSYEIPLEHDFVNPDAEDMRSDSSVSLAEMKSKVCRKMSATDFEPLTCLGTGTYGTVFLVKHHVTGALYAQKQFRKASLTVHKKLVEQTKTERAILESISRHPFVVKLFYAFQDHEKLYLILEYAQGGELFTHLAMERMFTEEVASFYMAELVLALEHLHHNVGVIYRDLKPENCLLDSDGHLLLTDFGLSKVAADDQDRCNSSLGTVEYMAPEVVQGKSYGRACDWWSLGALGFDLLTGSPPFKGNNHAKIQERIVKQKLTMPYFLSPDAKDLLTRLLRKDPHKRLGYHMPKDMQTIKKHRFFRKIDWKALEARELEAPIKPLITDPALAENFSTDFTTLPLSPVVSAKPGFPDDDIGAKDIHLKGGISGHHHRHASRGSFSMLNDDPFGGFSFVASSSLLDSGIGFGK